MRSELWTWTTAELAAAIGSGAVSSVQATESALARMDAVNPALNAVVDPLREEAMVAAREADAALRRGGPSARCTGFPSP